LSLDFTQQRIARVLADQYQILDFLGSGGFAQVYRAVNRTLGRGLNRRTEVVLPQ